jgi:phosphoadenosine phosphosulfate reductase
MLLETVIAPIHARVAALNHQFQGRSAQAALKYYMANPQFGTIAMVSSFGAESVALLHMISQIDRTLPVLFLDTELLFAETLRYQLQVTELLKLNDVRTIRPDRNAMFARDQDGLLHQRDPDACCTLRKSEPLQQALAPFDSWITGRKQFQGQQRQNLQMFESEGENRIKLNPLTRWTAAQIRAYISKHNLPLHPLVAGGFPSIGCHPCTTRVADGEANRAGRWRGRDKDECGIHFEEPVRVRQDRAA